MYNHKISNLRAIAILSVIIGHSIIIYSHNWGLMPTQIQCPTFDNLHAFVSLYQMPLFFFISGFLFNRSLKKHSLKSFIKNKVQRLLIPYFCIGLLWMIPLKLILKCPFYTDKSLISILLRFISGQENGHLWFLYTLFFIFIGFYLANILLNGYKWKNEIILLLSFIACIIDLPIPYRLAHFGFWFQIGFYINQQQYSSQKYMLLFLLLLMFTAIIFSRQNLQLGLIIVIGLYYLVPNKPILVLNNIDKNSFGLYLLHSPLIYITYTYIPNEPPVFVFLINFILGGGIAYAINYLISRSKFRYMVGIIK